MLSQRQRPLVWGILGLAAAWLVAGGGYLLAKSHRVTAEKVRAFLHSVDLDKLSGDARAQALRELARQLNALPYEDRRTARLDREWSRWFAEMTEPEKGAFVEATLPTGFKQALNSFEQLPPDRRRRSLDEALRRLKEARSQWESGDSPPPTDGTTNPPPVISEELRQRIITTGLKSFYSESSAQTKAEAAPLLEELQRMAENGAFLRYR